MTVPNEHHLGIEHRNVASANSGVSDLDFDYWLTYLLYRTTIDSHASMATLGKNVKIINDSDRKVEVSFFNLDYESLSKVSIVDTDIRCQCLVRENKELILHPALLLV